MEKPNPLKRRLSDHERIAQQQDLKHELKGEYAKWLNQDVLWIITDTERQAFKNLSNDEEQGSVHRELAAPRPQPRLPDNEYRE